MSKKKKHHYIQKALIKHFASDDHVFVYDKNKKAIRKNHVDDVFEANNFYRIPLTDYWDSISQSDKDEIDREVLKQFGRPFEHMSDDEKCKVEEWVEDFFADTIEPLFISTLLELKQNIGLFLLKKMSNPLTEQIRYYMTICLVYYFCRTKGFRDSLEKGTSDYYKQLYAIQSQMNGISVDYESIKIEFTKEQSRMRHLQFLTYLEEDESLSRTIFGMKWSIAVNETQLPFVLSDNLLTIKLTEKIPAFYGAGLGTYGSEIYCALTPKIMLILNEPNAFHYLPGSWCSRIKEEKIINEINEFVMRNCYESCVSSDKDYLQFLMDNLTVI